MQTESAAPSGLNPVADFTQQWLRAMPSLRRYCAKQICNAADCDDILQQTAFHAWSGYDSLRDSSRFDAWVFMIARAEINKVIRLRIQGRALSKDLETAAPDTSGMPSAEAVAADPAPDGWLAQVIRQAAAAGALTPNEAATVTHRLKHEETPWQHASAALGLSPNVCAQNFVRSLPKIRTWVLCHHRELVGGTLALTSAARHARHARPNPLTDFEFEVFSARILKNDTTYCRAGWRTALRGACTKIANELALPGAERGLA